MISCDVAASVSCDGGLTGALPGVHFSFDPADPLVVTLTIPDGDGGKVWEFARGLLVAALISPIGKRPGVCFGLGDVQVTVRDGTLNVLLRQLGSKTTPSALISVEAAPVRKFIAESLRLVPDVSDAGPLFEAYDRAIDAEWREITA